MYCALSTLLVLVHILGGVTAYSYSSGKPAYSLSPVKPPYSFSQPGRTYGDDEGVNNNNFPSYNPDVDVDWVKPSNPFVPARYVIQPSQDYSYTEQGGPRGWPAIFPKCGGTRQSPVDINSFTIQRKHMKHLDFRDFWNNKNTALVNNTGKHLKVTLQGNFTLPTVMGGPLDDEYTFDQLHFHWGADNDEGSEHTVDLQSFSVEAHVVHFKTSYGTLTEAANHEDGLVVIAFFLQASKHEHNPAFNDIASRLRSVRKAYSTVKLPSAGMAFNWFKDLVWGDYAIYPGSLTTPPCSEVVTWLVYTRPSTISTKQVEEFRSLRSSNGSKIKINYRPIQRFVVPGLYGPRH